MASQIARPAHVPAELFMDTSIPAIAREADDPFLGIAKLYEGPDIVWMTNACRGVPGWIPTRHSVIQDIFMDHDTFSSTQNGNFAEIVGVDWSLNPLEIDPPSHTAFRKVLQPRFGPASINAFDKMIREVCDDLIGRFEAKNSCDFIGDFGDLFPSYVFLKLADLPLVELPQFLEWEKAFIRGTDLAARAAGARAIVQYLERHIDNRRRNPGDDLISHVVTARIDGEPMREGDVKGMCTLLYMAGLDTVLNMLGWCMRALVMDAELQRRLRTEPDAISAAVSEFMRAFGITLTKRTVTKDVVFHGVQMKAGDHVGMPTCLASRDPRQWTNPNKIDLDRKGNNLTLATGIHSCLGAHLARREVKVVLEQFLSRFANIRLQPGADVKWHSQGNFGVDSLPITWDPA